MQKQKERERLINSLHSQGKGPTTRSYLVEADLDRKWEREYRIGNPIQNGAVSEEALDSIPEK